MTSQTVIINKNLTINVSDKNGTNENDKSYGGHRKIIKLRNDPPVSLMYNGNVEFEGISIENLVHEFKKKKDLNKMKSVRTIRDEFIIFISHETEFTDLNTYIMPIINEFKKEIKKEPLDKIIEIYEKRKIPKFLQKLPAFKTEFRDIIPPNAEFNEVNETLWEMFSWYLSYEGSNLIFSGSSNGNYYPSLFEVNIHCNDSGNLIYENIEEHEYCRKPFFKVFAQNREAYTYITGIDDELLEFIKIYIKEYDNEIVNDFKNYLINKNVENYDDIINKLELIIHYKHDNLNQDINILRLDGMKDACYYLEYLPKDLLYFFGDFLVKSVALKQRISDDIDSVSIETDIALMTNATGFKWIENI